MARDYSSQSIVELPRVRGPQAMALIQLLVIAARKHGGEVPGLRAAVTRLASARDALRAALVAAGENPTARYGADVVAADAALDACWAALFGVLGGWSRAPEGSNAAALGADAARVSGAVFVDGMRFTQLSYAEEWSESEVHLERIAGEDHEEVIKRLGATPLLASVRAAHKTYGVLLGLSAESGRKRKGERLVDRPDVRVALDESLAAMRSYVLKVAAQSDEHPDAASELLRPLTEWESGTRAKAAANDVEEDDAGKGDEKGSEKKA